MGVVRRGSTVAQLGFIPGRDITIGPEPFEELLLRAGERLPYLPAALVEAGPAASHPAPRVARSGTKSGGSRMCSRPRSGSVVPTKPLDGEVGDEAQQPMLMAATVAVTTMAAALGAPAGRGVHR